MDRDSDIGRDGERYGQGEIDRCRYRDSKRYREGVNRRDREIADSDRQRGIQQGRQRGLERDVEIWIGRDSERDINRQIYIKRD